MKIVPFIADDAATALARIHAELGPDAVVLSVRPLPRQGLARLWQKGGAVEVVAGVLDDKHPPDPRRRPDLLPTLQSRLSPTAADAPPLYDGRPHVFIGPPGVGKTTLLCKWMAFAVLNENRTARVWRLDGATANTAEFLNIYGEMLTVRVERFWNDAAAQTDLCLIDLPGVPHDDVAGLRALAEQVTSIGSARVHLVLNAAYDSSVLTEQFRAFSPFKLEDLSFCHLDEEKRHGKLSDFLLGTNCYLRFLSTGQKIPGDFHVAGVSKPVRAPLSA
jgi:flagellar biosynthesis GTPase FlhF